MARSFAFAFIRWLSCCASRRGGRKATPVSKGTIKAYDPKSVSLSKKGGSGSGGGGGKK
jgi:hypothetical protein